MQKNFMEITSIITLITFFIAAVYDYKKYIIPNWCTLPLIGFGIFYRIYTNDSILNMVIILLLFLAFTYITGIGYGDIKLLLGCALTLGMTFTFKMYLTANCMVGLAFVLLRIKDLKMGKNVLPYWMQQSISYPMGFPFAVATVIGISVGFLI